MTECVTHVPAHPLPMSPVYTALHGRADLTAKTRPCKAMTVAPQFNDSIKLATSDFPDCL